MGLMFLSTYKSLLRKRTVGRTYNLDYTVVFFKVRENSNFGQGVAKPPRNLTKIFFNLW